MPIPAKKEIFANGPVVAVINVYRDFLNYKDGYYDAEKGQFKYTKGHAVKVFGWGYDNRE